MLTIAPLQLAEEWDNVGLLVGDALRPLSGPVLLTIDLDTAVAEEAIAMNAGAIVAYHPPIFRPFKRLTAESGHGALLLRLIERGLAIYSPHTALDAVPGGVTDWLIAQACSTEPDAQERDGSVLGAKPLACASGSAGDGNETHKVVTFVPREAVERVRGAMASAGAGVIGHYDVCSFGVEGRGTFRGDASSNPAVGERGRMESVEEVRLEMVCGGGVLAAVVGALRGAHPYEEPAFDVYALVPKPRRGSGSGRIVTLGSAESVEAIAERLKSRLGVAGVFVALPSAPLLARGARMVTRVAAVPGSGAGLLDAAIDAGAECFVTGEMKHHEVLGAVERGCAVILAGHTETERGFLAVLAMRLNGINKDFGARVSLADAAPLRMV